MWTPAATAKFWGERVLLLGLALTVLACGNDAAAPDDVADAATDTGPAGDAQDVDATDSASADADAG